MSQPEVEQHNMSSAYHERLEAGWAAGTADRDAGSPRRYHFPEHGDAYMRDPFVEGYIDAYPEGDS